MEIQNTFNGKADNVGPKTPNTDKVTKGGTVNGGSTYNPNESGDSAVQEGEGVVNQQNQNVAVNGQEGVTVNGQEVTGGEEYISDVNRNTVQANDTPLNNENGLKDNAGIQM